MKLWTLTATLANRSKIESFEFTTTLTCKRTPNETATPVSDLLIWQKTPQLRSVVTVVSYLWDMTMLSPLDACGASESLRSLWTAIVTHGILE